MDERETIFIGAPDPPNTSPHLFTTLRYDPDLLTSPSNTAVSPSHAPSPFYMLQHHWDRLEHTPATIFPATDLPPVHPSRLFPDPPTFHRRLSAAIIYWRAQHPAAATPLRLRIACHPAPTPRLTLTLAPTPAVPLAHLFPTILHPPAACAVPHWLAAVDAHRTAAAPQTAHKTSERGAYVAARVRARLRNPPDTAHSRHEVLLVNGRGDMMDGSVTTPYFWRAGGWVTPAAGCGPQRGTTRRWALERGLCVEGTVGADGVREWELVWLSNAVVGWYLARVTLGDVDDSGLGE